MERNMEMSQKYIMQSNKWHAAEQRGNVSVVEQLGTIHRLQNRNGDVTVLGQDSTPRLSASCHQLLFFPSLSKASTDLGISRCPFLGSHILISYKCNLQHLLLSQPLEPSERENTGYWEAHGLFV